jgi:LysM repeat protein
LETTRLTIKKISSLTLSLLIILSFSPSSAREKTEEETYSISLVKTAEVDKQIYKVGKKRVLTETYSVQKGEHLWQILRQKGLLKKRNIREILSTLKKLNRSLTNLDLIHPGQKIIIPLTISPIEGIPILALKVPPTPFPIEKLKELDLENYTVKRGDSLIRVVQGRYNVPDHIVYNEYLNFVKKLNPSIKDLNLIYPGQIIRLPIYSAQKISMPIEPAPPPKSKPQAQKKSMNTIGSHLGQIFTLLGEEWVQSGEHMIPLKSGGQINLKADSYPIINLSTGNRVIVDLHNNLPKKMGDLITSNWTNYQIIHLGKEYDLRRSLNTILPACNYGKVYGLGEPLVLGGDIPLSITADWMIRLNPGVSDEGGQIVMITLSDDFTQRTPQAIRSYLNSLGIRAIDYPQADMASDKSTKKVEVLKVGDASALIELILKLTGHKFSGKVEIPIYKRQKKDFKFVIKADYLLNVGGKDCIIDLSGLGTEIISLLEEHQFRVLPLSGEKDPSFILSRTLKFVGVKFDSDPHSFLANDRDESRNIRLTIPGIVFRDRKGKSVLTTHITLPTEIVTFLSQRGYTILSLPLS